MATRQCWRLTSDLGTGSNSSRAETIGVERTERGRRGLGGEAVRTWPDSGVEVSHHVSWCLALLRDEGWWGGPSRGQWWGAPSSSKTSPSFALLQCPILVVVVVGETLGEMGCSGKHKSRFQLREDLEKRLRSPLRKVSWWGGNWQWVRLRNEWRRGKWG